MGGTVMLEAVTGGPASPVSGATAAVGGGTKVERGGPLEAIAGRLLIRTPLRLPYCHRLSRGETAPTHIRPLLASCCKPRLRRGSI